jgi:hypothetical protein
MDASRYRLSIVTLPMETDARYRLDVRTVQPTLLLQHYGTAAGPRGPSVGKMIRDLRRSANNAGGGSAQTVCRVLLLLLLTGLLFGH